MDESRLRTRQQAAARPAVGAREAVTAGPSTAAFLKRPGQRALVAVVDPATVRRCRDVLEGCGFVVVAVDAGIAALVAARNGPPDVIFMDLQLRDAPGREAIGWLRSNPALQSTPIILLTGSADDEVDLTAIGPAAFLRKPVSPGMIQRSIHEVLK